MTSLAYIFTLEKSLSRIQVYLAVKYFICQPIFKILRHFLRLLECKRKIRSHFAEDVSEQGDMQNGSFQRMVQIE